MERFKYGISGEKTEYDCQTSEIALFDIPKFESNYEKTTIIEHHCDGTLDQNGPYRVCFVGNADQNIDPKNINIVVEGQLVGKNSHTDLPYDEHEVGVVMNLIHALFSHIYVEINNIPNSELTQEYYAVKATIENLVNNSPNSIDHQGITSLMIPDEANSDHDWKKENVRNHPAPTKTDIPAAPASGADDATIKAYKEKVNAYNDKVTAWKNSRKSYKTGLFKRIKLLTQGQQNCFQLTAPFMLDFFNIHDLLPTKTSITLTLNRTPKDFYIMTKETEDTYIESKILITKLYFQVPYVELNSRIRAEHEKNFQMGKLCRLPYTRTHVLAKQFSSGTTDLNWENITQGTLPKMVLLFVIPTTALNGTVSTNPFYITNCNISSISLRVNNEIIPRAELKIDFNRNKYQVAYQWFLRNLGYKSDQQCLVNAQYWKNGATIFPFDLTPDMCNGYHFHTTKNGVLGARIQLAEALKESHTLMAIVYMDKIISFDEFRNTYIQSA